MVNNITVSIRKINQRELDNVKIKIIYENQI